MANNRATKSFWLTVLVLFIAVVVRQAVAVPYCVNDTSLAFYPDGNISITATLLNCFENVMDVVLFPGYSTNKVFEVQTQVAVNNLIQINELENSVTLDLFLRLYWTDLRLLMPDFWKYLSPRVRAAGLEIDPIITSGLANIWFPDIFFPDASDYTVTDFLIRLYPNGQIEWSRHITLTLVQSQFDYHSYPDDTQTIQIRYNSYGLNTDFVVMKYRNPPVVLYKNKDRNYALMYNPIWKLKDYMGEIVIEDNGTPGNPRLRSVALVTLTMERASQGVIDRLGLPVFLLVLLAALTFWSPEEDRVGTTVTLLLSVSALYIVVFNNIPMIGYQTDFDEYMTVMFCMLFGCTVIHQYTSSSSPETLTPYQKFLLSTSNSLGRIVVPVISVFLYFLWFGRRYTFITFTLSICAVAVFELAVGIVEFRSIYKNLQHLLHGIKKKMHAIADLGDYNGIMSPFQMFLFNVFHYGKFTSSTEHVEAERGAISEEKVQINTIPESSPFTVDVSISESKLENKACNDDSADCSRTNSKSYDKILVKEDNCANWANIFSR